MQRSLLLQQELVLQACPCDRHGISCLRRRTSAEGSEETVWLLDASDSHLVHPVSTVPNLQLKPAGEFRMRRLASDIAMRKL